MADISRSGAIERDVEQVYTVFWGLVHFFVLYWYELPLYYIWFGVSRKFLLANYWQIIP